MLLVIKKTTEVVLLGGRRRVQADHFGRDVGSLRFVKDCQRFVLDDLRCDEKPHFK